MLVEPIAYGGVDQSGYATPGGYATPHGQAGTIWLDAPVQSVAPGHVTTITPTASYTPPAVTYSAPYSASSYVPPIGGGGCTPPASYVPAGHLVYAAPPVAASAYGASTPAPPPQQFAPPLVPSSAGTQVLSYVTPGHATPGPPGGPPVQHTEPQPPQSLTSGIPDPNSIDRQKAAYAKGLDDQLKHGTDVLSQQLKQQSDYLFAMGDQQKRQYNLQVDQQIKQQEMALAQQHNEQLLMLQHAAQQQKSALEHQANALVLEYNQRKAHEDLSFQQYHFQKQHYETQLQYNDEMKKLQEQQTAAANQVAQQQLVIAQQAQAATQQAQQAQCHSASALQNSNTSFLVTATPPQNTYGSATPSAPPPNFPQQASSVVTSYGPAPPLPGGMSYSLPAASSYAPAPNAAYAAPPTTYGAPSTFLASQSSALVQAPLPNASTYVSTSSAYGPPPPGWTSYGDSMAVQAPQPYR